METKKTCQDLFTFSSLELLKQNTPTSRWRKATGMGVMKPCLRGVPGRDLLIRPETRCIVLSVRNQVLAQSRRESL